MLDGTANKKSTLHLSKEFFKIQNTNYENDVSVSRRERGED